MIVRLFGPSHRNKALFSGKMRSNYTVNRSIVKLADDQEDGSNGPSLSGDFLEMQSMAVMGGAASCPESVDAERRASAGNFQSLEIIDCQVPDFASEQIAGDCPHHVGNAWSTSNHAAVERFRPARVSGSFLHCGVCRVARNL